MDTCSSCGRAKASRIIGLCADCLRSRPKAAISPESHQAARRKFHLPPSQPQHPGGTKCRLCANECRPGIGERGYCGLRKNVDGKMASISPRNAALVHMYFDPLPTNCCAAWFCKGSGEGGYNLAVFFYGCNFDCFFCQNHSHKLLEDASLLTEDKIIAAALLPEVSCVCFFGGSPEPQLPFALRVSQKVIERSRNKKHICWEWNGCGNPALAKKAAELSARSGGTVKFDLKAFHPNISLALSGVENRRAFDNFTMLARLFPKRDMLTATTLLVPFYVEREEVREIARFISEQDKDIPYSLLLFHPDFLMTDLPTTPRRQLDECYEEARQYLSRVHVGNIHLL